MPAKRGNRGGTEVAQTSGAANALGTLNAILSAIKKVIQILIGLIQLLKGL